MDILKEITAVVVTSVVSLAAMFVLTRWGGKRQITQMSIFDYANSITIGSIAAEMATNLEQWYRPLTALAVYGAAAWLVHYAACKSMMARTVLYGRAIVLMENGTIYKSELGRAAIDLNEFLAQARVAGYYDPNEIQTAILETNGQVSFLPKSRNRPATPEDLGLHPDAASRWYDLVLDGKIMPDNLKKSGRDESWLRGQLSGQGIGQVGEAFYAACDNGDGFFACRAK